LLGAVVVIAAWGYRPLFHLLTDEDHVLEWLQFAGYAAATLLGASVAIRLWRGGTRPLAALFALFALGCLFIAGEEVSWGQRIFGWSTPEPLAQVNHQDETTVHNIGAFSITTNLAMLAIGAYGSLAPWLARRHRARLPVELTRFVVPPLFLSSAFLMLFAYKAVRFAVFPDPQSATVSFGEWPELCLACALMTFALLIRRHVAAPEPAMSRTFAVRRASAAARARRAARGRAAAG
jgi:hypothetical protein